MSKTSNFWNYLIIVCFSAALVALGAGDLQKRYFPDRAKLRRAKPSNISQTLHGSETFDRGRFTWKSTPARTGKPSSIIGNRENESRPTRQVARGSVPAGTKDSLSSQDRRELDQLLDRINP